jgi:elongator complex protein 4
MDNNLGFKLKRRRGLVVETLHLDEGGGTSERRTTPAPQLDVPTQAPIKTVTQINDIIPEQTGNPEASPSKPAKKKFERRRIRFDDDPNENPSGILGSKSSEPVHSSGLQRDKPQLYEF